MSFDLDAMFIDRGVGAIAGPGGRKAVRRGFMDAMRKALAITEKHHKRKEWIRGGDGPPHPRKLTLRTGSLSRSYTRRLLHRELAGAYGSDLVYAPVHEFGSPTLNIPARPGLKRTIDAKIDKIEKILADGAVRYLGREEQI
jgi:phage gpG-like protein